MLKSAQKINICAVINDLGIGGAQRILSDLVLVLSKEHVRVSVINLTLVPDEEIERELVSAGVRVLRCPFSSKKDVRRLIWLYRNIKAERPDIIHSHLWFASIMSALVGRLAGCRRFVSTEHNTTTFDTRPLWYIGLARLYLKLNQAHCAVSKAVEKLVRQKSPAVAPKTFQIYNGIDTHLFSPIDKKPIDKTALTVGTLVRDDPRKGFSIFIEFAKRASEKQMPLRCVAAHWTLTGHEDCVDYVKIDGSRESVADYMRRLDIFVLPSFEEGLGLVLLEAMASGAAVVASNIGGILEIIQHGRNGLLFQVGDPTDLLAKIDHLLQNPVTRQQLIQQGRDDTVDRFSLSAMVTAYCELYDSMMEN